MVEASHVVEGLVQVGAGQATASGEEIVQLAAMGGVLMEVELVVVVHWQMAWEGLLGELIHLPGGH